MLVRVTGGGMGLRADRGEVPETLQWDGEASVPENEKAGESCAAPKGKSCKGLRHLCQGWLSLAHQRGSYTMYIQQLIRLNKELLSWLNTQSGMIPRDYARDLARLLSRIESEQKDSTKPERTVDLKHEA